MKVNDTFKLLGDIIDLSIHNPTAITNVYNCKEDTLLTAQEYAFGRKLHLSF